MPLIYKFFEQGKAQAVFNRMANRRRGTQQQYLEQKQLMEREEEEDNNDEVNQDYTQDQWEQVCYVADTLNIDQQSAAEALDKFNFDQSKAIDYLVKKIERQATAKEKEKQKKKDKQKQRKREEEALKPTKFDETSVSNFSMSKKKSQNPPMRKISSQDIPLNTRKSSLIVQEYPKDHYNIDYPDFELKHKVEPSKTLNVVVVGHVDSGKSTLVGKLMHLINQVSKKQAHKNEKQSKEMGKQSFKYAWITDETEEQRARGVTIDVGVKKITLKDRNVVFLDSPGHRDFIPNMITGAAQADYAILVIDATHFDSTFISGGQTKEHAYIVKSLGVQTIIVAMNKMDIISWNPEAFETIKNKLNYYLFSIGFLESHIIYVPISAFLGINIDDSNVKKFESGGILYKKTLIQVLEQLPLPIRPLNKPLRVNITNFYESPVGKLKGHCISGKIEGGVLRKDEKYVILPQDCQCIVKQILVGNDKVKEAVVGDNVDIQIKLIDETYFETIKFGNVLSSLTYSIPVSNKFVMEAMALQLQMPILKGASVMIYIGSNKTTARITKINCKYDPKTGTIIKKNCKSIHSNDCVEIEVESDQKVCIEKFCNSKIFGRVIIREKKSTLCVGTVTMIK